MKKIDVLCLKKKLFYWYDIKVKISKSKKNGIKLGYVHYWGKEL